MKKLIFLSLSFIFLSGFSCSHKTKEPQSINTVYSLRTGEQVVIPSDPSMCVEQMKYHGVSIGVCQDIAW